MSAPSSENKIKFWLNVLCSQWMIPISNSTTSLRQHSRLNMLTMRICVVNRNSNAAFYKNYYPEEIIDDWYGKVVQWQGNMRVYCYELSFRVSQAWEKQDLKSTANMLNVIKLVYKTYIKVSLVLAVLTCHTFRSSYSSMHTWIWSGLKPLDVHSSKTSASLSDFTPVAGTISRMIW